MSVISMSAKLLNQIVVESTQMRECHGERKRGSYSAHPIHDIGDVLLIYPYRKHTLITHCERGLNYKSAHYIWCVSKSARGAMWRVWLVYYQSDEYMDSLTG